MEVAAAYAHIYVYDQVAAAYEHGAASLDGIMEDALDVRMEVRDWAWKR